MPANTTGSGARAVIKAPKKKPAKVKAPAAKQVAQARAQEQAYISQGQAVKNVAKAQTKVRVRKQQLKASKPAAGDAPQTRKADTAKAQAYVKKQYTAATRGGKTVLVAGPGGPPVTYKPGTTVPPDVQSGVLAGRHRAAHSSLIAARLAPVLTVLDQTTRPLHAVAGAADAALTHKPILKAALRGVQNKDRTTFSTVLKHAGVKNKTVRGIAGFGLDVAADPLTYVTGGTASLALKSGAKAAGRVESKALKAGLTKDQAVRAGQRARNAAEKKAPAGKGVTVRVAGKDVPGVAKATHAARPVRAAARKAVPENTRGSVRSVAADVNPNIAPAGVPKAVHQAQVTATRTARSKANQGTRTAVNLAHGIRKQIGEQNYTAVVDAIEAGNLKGLSPELAAHAHTLRSQLKGIRRVQRRAGVKVPERKGYVPRQLTPEAVAAKDLKASRPGKASTKPGSSKARKETRPMSVLRTVKPDQYRQDLHAVVAERLAEGHSSAALAELNQRLGSLGTAVKRGTVPAVQKGDAVFHIKAGNAPRQVTDKTEIARAAAPLKLNKAGTKVKNATPKSVGAGRYVVLNKDVVKRATEGAAPTLQGPGIVKGYDKLTSGFKRVALATPGFHLRNVVGDTFQAYVRQPGTKLAANMARSGKVLHQLGKQEKAQRVLGQPKPSGKTMRTGRYGHVSYEDIAKNLIDAGAARSGYTARELRDLSKSGKEGKLSIGRAKAPAGVKRAFLNREDLPRLATAIYHLRKGATWEEAAKAVADTHFDYGHLTSFERNFARRIMPFYTWTARNIPFTAKNVISRPGKYANYQKIREEAAAATQPGQTDPKTKALYAQLEQAGVKLPGGYAKYLSEWEQRNAGVPVSWKGHKFTVSMGLPLQDLNELPGAAGTGQAREYLNKAASMLSPVIKDPGELGFNYSLFFRDQIQRDNSPLVAAPSFVGSFPDAMKRKLGVTKMIDKKSGKKVWAWPGKVDYVAHAVPGVPNLAQQLATKGTDRRGKGMGGKLLGVAGVKSVPIDATHNAVNLAYARQQEIQARLARLRQSGVGKANPTAEWRRLNDQLKLVGQIAFQGKVGQGYKVLPTSGGPPKVRASGGVKLNGTGSSGVTLNGSGSGGVKLN